MSEEWNEFDQVTQERLSDFSVHPPESVWDNIQSARTFGHVVANRISRNWQTFGTLLFLLSIGGSAALSFGIEEHIEDVFPTYFENIQLVNRGLSSKNLHILHLKNSTLKKSEFEATKLNSSPKHTSTVKIVPKKKSAIKNNRLYNYIQPDQDLLASVHAVGFARPNVKDERLSAYIETLSGWESAHPKSYTRYNEMSTINKKNVHNTLKTPQPVFAEIDYDYVRKAIRNKPFKERLSLLVALTPQSIHKTIIADFNLSSAYIQERNMREKTRFAYSFGASLQYEFSNYKFLETGLLYTQIYEEMHIEGEKRFSNQYDFFEIPVLFGFEQRNAKWGWHVKGGLGLQLFNSYKGYILNPLEDIRELSALPPRPQFRIKDSDAFKNIIANKHQLSPNQNRDEVIDLSNDEENPFKRSGVVNIHMATGLTYFHSIRTNFLITPYYRRSINSITKERTRFRENISYTGISLGARFKF